MHLWLDPLAVHFKPARQPKFLLAESRRFRLQAAASQPFYLERLSRGLTIHIILYIIYYYYINTPTVFFSSLPN
jgi:hypothetical protein